MRRADGGRVLIGGSPLRIVRLTDAGVAVFEEVASGPLVAPSPTVAALVDRLVAGGLVHPEPEPGSGPFAPGDVTVVIPVRWTDDRGAGAGRRWSVLAEGSAGVVVVDDGSPARGAAALSAAVADAGGGVRLVRREVSGGPAAARSTGLVEVTTPLVAFVDDDVEVDAGWLDGLLAHFVDPAVVAVAPRVRSRPAAGGGGSPRVLARYEAARSPLDLGAVPALVQPGGRVAYVPAAALVVRVGELATVGGFDPALRYGEDVDLVWRLVGAGGRVRYEPAVAVTHPARAGWSAWAWQRFGYGSSAAALDERHPGEVAPLRCSGWSAGAWALVACGHPVVGIGVAAGTVAALARRLDHLEHPVREAVRLGVVGHLMAGEQAARACWRPWFPLTLAAALVSRRARRAAVAAAIVPHLLSWRRTRPALDPVRWTAMAVADDVAYSAGVWAGVQRTGRWGAVLPRFTSWPGRRPAVRRN